MNPSNPDYYNKYAIEPLDFIHANNITFIEGNIIKYICRWRNKNGIEDLEKALTYLQYLLDKEKQNS
jgi:hypothetical protein